MSERVPQASWRVFARRRWGVHAEAWVYAQVLPWWLGLIGSAPDTAPPDAALIIAAGLTAVVMAGLFALVAALLRVPWWLLWPLCWLSMRAEWWLRLWLDRPWLRAPAHRRWYLSNPVALWQRWRLGAQRRARRARRRAQTACAIPGPSVWDYAFDHLSAHVTFWYWSGFVLLWIVLTSKPDFNWLGGLLLAFVIYLVATFTMVALVVCGVLGFLSALLVGASLSPLEREQARRDSLGTADNFSLSATAPGPSPAAPSTAQPRRSSWWVPFVLGIMLGSAWADDDRSGR